MIKLDKMPKGVLHGLVLIKPEEVEVKTKSGIIITTEEKKPKPYTGKVILSADDTVVKEGQRVLFNENSGVECEIEGSGYLLMTEKGHVHAIL